MTNRPAGSRRHLASSPFQPKPEQVIETYALDDRVCHESFGLGRVIGVEDAAVTVDFGNGTRRIVSPFNKLERL